ncbi:OPT oligopeptide transporter [Mycena rebaudengoi]|nr:OPT oligopeptide transporter [Mycena rebaudengoi]
MAAVQQQPDLEKHGLSDSKRDSQGSLSDEKSPEKVDLDNIEEVGEVFADGPRLIDLGEDGRERPIVTDHDYATRLIALDDDPTLRVFTFRMWFLAVGLSCFSSVLGQISPPHTGFQFFRPQQIVVSQLFIQIIGFVLGRFALIRTADNAFWRFFNHGRFNLKEHVAITIMASTASSSALAISIFAAQDLFYHVEANVAVGIFTLIGSQLIGYGMAGIMRVFLVYPTFAVYPQIFPTVQLFEALHRGEGHDEPIEAQKYIFLAIFVWEWFPEYIAPTLTGISIFCLANQKSAWFTRIFGGAAGNEGLGMFLYLFDWAYVGAGGGSIGSLFTPLSTQLSLYGGCAVCMIAFCACFAMNTWNTQNFPFLTQLLYYENGTVYDQLAILNDDFTLNEEKLAVQGLPWVCSVNSRLCLPAALIVSAAITHFGLWHGKTVYKLIRAGREGNDDPHFKKMKAYPEVSNWIYLAMFVGCLAMAIGTTYGAKSQLPAWATIIAVLFGWLFVPVIGTLYATVGYAPSIQNVVQMLGGALVPGKPVANMYFTMYGYQPVVQAYTLTADLKIGQYTKLPPRATFAVQTVGAVIGGLLNFIIMKVVITAQRPILLDVQGTNIWSGQAVQSFNSAAVAWGALGKTPLRYRHALRSEFDAGFNFVFTPVVTAELGFLSVGINSSVFTSFLLAIFSQHYLRKYRATWFRKYNFLLSAALDGGTSVMIFVMTFAVGGGSGTVRPMPNWALNPVGNPDYCKRLSK